MDTDHSAPTESPKPARKPRRLSAETIRNRATFLIGSGNVRELAKAGYVVVPREYIADLHDMIPPTEAGDLNLES